MKKVFVIGIVFVLFISISAAINAGVDPTEYGLGRFCRDVLPGDNRADCVRTWDYKNGAENEENDPYLYCKWWQETDMMYVHGEFIEYPFPYKNIGQCVGVINSFGYPTPPE